MYRFYALIMIFAALFIAGCGGSNGNGDVNDVQIQSTQFVPKVITINAGDSVRWRNSDSQTHRIVSGELLPVTDPDDAGTILILNSNQFSPSFLEADFGDTVAFSNERTLSFDLEIVDDAGNVVISRTLGPNELIEIGAGAGGFPSAGAYTFRRQGSLTFVGTLILTGVPDPDGEFMSEPLAPGATFTRQFPVPGVFPYFSQDETDPNESFITGTVVVQ